MLTAAVATIAVAHHPALTAHSFSTIHGAGMVPPIAARDSYSIYTLVIATPLVRRDGSVAATARSQQQDYSGVLPPVAA